MKVIRSGKPFSVVYWDTEKRDIFFVGFDTKKESEDFVSSLDMKSVRGLFIEAVMPNA